MSKVKAGIVGAAGYTGGEMLRILLNHPKVELHFILSKSSASKKLYEVHRDLLGESELTFDGEIKAGADVIFLCLGHGDSRLFMDENSFEDQVKIIDLSQDFRLASNLSHRKADSLRTFTYGLPELKRDEIKTARNVANPGCFATAIQLALLPLAEKGLLKNEIHISAITGSTGAGQSLSTTSHFSWRAGNFSVYKAFTHQHLAEIKQGLNEKQRLNLADGSASSAINLIPYRGDFTRGIIASVYTSIDISLTEAKKIYENFYLGHPFTWLADGGIDLKQVVGTNKAFLSLEYHEGKLLIVCIIDNLLKGASGQAVQNMNLMFGFPEDQGLRLKSIVF